MEGPERDDEWQVARTLVTVVKGHLPKRVRNLNPYPILIPQRRPLANVFQVDPSQIRGEKDLVLKPSNPGVIEVDVHANWITLLCGLPEAQRTHPQRRLTPAQDRRISYQFETSHLVLYSRPCQRIMAGGGGSKGSRKDCIRHSIGPL